MTKKPSITKPIRSSARFAEIPINQEHYQEIADALDTLQGRATADIFSAGDVLQIASAAERSLQDAGIAASHRCGASLYVTPSGPSCTAYKYKRLGTSLRLLRKSTGWNLSDAYRQAAWPRQRGHQLLTLSVCQKGLALKSAMKRYDISPEEAVAALLEFPKAC